VSNSLASTPLTTARTLSLHDPTKALSVLNSYLPIAKQQATLATAYLDDYPLTDTIADHIHTLTTYAAKLETAIAAAIDHTALAPFRNAAEQATLALSQMDLSSLHKQAVQALSAYTDTLQLAVQLTPPAEITLYVYRCRTRPPGYGTVPDGRLVDRDLSGFAWNDQGTVTYPRPLTPAEIYRFDLLPLSPEPKLPLYPAGASVRDLRNKARSYIVECFDGQYSIGDCVMERLTDWLFYEPIG
jgi:hypothetical protein